MGRHIGILSKQKVRIKNLIEALNNDEVITLKTNKERCELYDYMEDNGIDPDNYQTNGPDIWLA